MQKNLHYILIRVFYTPTPPQKQQSVYCYLPYYIITFFSCFCCCYLHIIFNWIEKEEECKNIQTTWADFAMQYPWPKLAILTLSFALSHLLDQLLVLKWILIIMCLRIVLQFGDVHFVFVLELEMCSGMTKMQQMGSKIC